MNDNIISTNDWTSTPIINRSNDTTIKSAGIAQTSTPKQYSFKITKLILKDIPKPRTPKLAAKSVSYTVSPYISPSRSALKSQKQSADLSLQPDLLNSTSVPENPSNDFHEKKMERNKCIEDFREYLEETLTVRFPNPSLKSSSQPQDEKTAIPAVKAISTAPTRLALKSRSKENLLIVPPKLSKSQNSRNQSATTFEKPKSLNISNAHKRIALESCETAYEKSVKKEKSYDPKIAQEFIKQQQEKRKQIATKPPFTQHRDLIKQRLADLRKNTLKIVSNNVKKSSAVKPNLQNQSIKGPSKRPTVVTQQRPKSLPMSRKSSSHNSKVVEQVPSKNVPLSRQSSTTSLKGDNNNAVKPLSRQLSSHSLKDHIANQPMVVTDNEIHKMHQLLLDLEQKHRVVQKVSALQPKPNNREDDAKAKTPEEPLSANPLSLKLNRKYSAHLITPDIIQKMGIRRKPDSLAMETPMSPLKLNVKPSMSEMGAPMPDNEVFNDTIPYREFSFNVDKDLDLKIPNVKLQSPALEQHSIFTNQDQTYDRPHRPNVPYWLQQTSVQPYPYNFITAVRKKLQAIVNADNKQDNKGVQTTDIMKVQDRRSERRTKDTAPHNLYQETPRVSKTAIAQKRKLDMKEWSTQHDLQLQSPTNGERISKSLSEVNTNMSSISMPISEVNTISEISSIKSDAQQRKSYSSSFQSNLESSPENMAHVPLISPSKTHDQEQKMLQRKSMTFVLNGSKVISDSPFDWQQKTVNATLVNHATEKLDVTQKQPIVDDSVEQMSKYRAPLFEKEQEYQKLLETFNKSLLQVVEVHQQLYSAFHHPKQDELPAVPRFGNLKPVVQRSIVTQTSPVITSTIPISSYDDDFENAAEIQDSSSRKTSTSTLKDAPNAGNSNQTEESVDNNTPTVSRTTKSQSLATETSLQTNTKLTSTSIKSDVSNSNNSIKTQINDSNARDDGKTFLLNYSESIIERSSKERLFGDESANSNKKSNKLLTNNILKDVSATKQVNNTTMGSEIFTYFNQSDIEVSYMSAGDVSNVSGKTNISYSNIGMVEQMIQIETNKSDQLGSLIKMREKALLDRTKGQIAWLELQKQQFKTKGMPLQISAIKKKQRAVLLRLQNEREELQKSAKQDTIESATMATNKFRLDDFDCSSISLRKTVTSKRTEKISAMKVYEFEANEELERILRKREEELKKRRDYVQRLLQWHEQLDREENEILQMENNLLNFTSTRNTGHRMRVIEESPGSHSENTPPIQMITSVSETDTHVIKRAKKLKQIEKSLRELQNVSTSNASFNGTVTEDDVVEMLGAKLNKLWHRLTGCTLPKYDASQMYQFDKITLERLYEDAKRYVLTGFQANEKNERIQQLFDSSAAAVTNASTTIKSNFEDDLLPMRTGENIFDNSDSSKKHHLTQLNIQNAASSESEAKERKLWNRDETPEEPIEDFPNETLIVEQSSETSFHCQEPDALDVLQRSIENITVERVAFDEDEESFHDDQEEPVLDDSSVAITKASTESLNWQPEKAAEEAVSDLDVTDESKVLEDLIEEHQILETGDDISSINDLKSLEDNNQSIEDDSIEFPQSRKREPSTTMDEPMIENISFPNFMDTTTDNITSNDAQQNACNSMIIEIDKTNAETILATTDNNDDDDVNKECDKTNISVDNDNILSAYSYENDDDPDDNASVRSDHPQTPSGSYDYSEKSIEFEEITEEDKVSSGSGNSELGKRLMTLNDSLEELSEIFSQKLQRASPVRSSPEIMSSSAPLSAMSSFLSAALTSYSNDLEFQEKQATSASKSEASSSEQTLIQQPTTTADDDKQVSDDEESNSIATLTPEKNLSPTFVQPLQSKDDKQLAQPLPNSISVIVRREELSFVPIVVAASTSTMPAATDSALTAKVPTKVVSTFSPQALHNNRIMPDMPDIINEAEVLRRQQLQIEQEIKQLEQQVVFYREIPNKPPPPYIPPTQGNPLSLIYPSTQRIYELVYDSVKELYNNDGLTPKSIIIGNETIAQPAAAATKNAKFSENIINTYEKIILDLCREFFVAFKQPTTNISFMKHKNYKNQLAFYNPPNGMECLQENILRRIKRILNIPNIDFSSGGASSSNSSMDNTSSPYDSYFINNFSIIRPHLYHNASAFSARRKRDHVDEILVDEMMEDEEKWTNFDNEEIEVKNDVTNQIMQVLLDEALEDLELAFNSKHKIERPAAFDQTAMSEDRSDLE